MFWTTRAAGLSDGNARVPVGIILALGVTQIIGYGTLYYSFSILAPDMAVDLGWSTDQIFLIFSAALLVGGLIAPVIGRWMDRFGAGRLMAIGSAVAALTLAACASSFSPAAYVASIVALEVASAMVLYQAAFAALVEISPRTAGRSITYLTLIAGFASTIFWPITSALHSVLGWREIYFIYAALNLAACLPLHFWIARDRSSGNTRASNATTEPIRGVLTPNSRTYGLVLATAAFALQGFALSAILVHMVPMLTSMGLGASSVMVGAIFGPAQVLSRLVNMLFGRDFSPVLLATLSAILVAAAIAVLVLSGSWLPGAVLFALLLGLGSGINSIAQGSLPLWLFGSQGYGALTGQMAAARLVTAAAAPFIFALMTERAGTQVALAVSATLGGAAIFAFIATWTLLRKS